MMLLLNDCKFTTVYDFVAAADKFAVAVVAIVAVVATVVVVVVALGTNV